MKEIPAKRMQAEHPERIVQWAILGMKPKTQLGKKMAKKQRVYAGPEHPHEAQRPEPLTF